jgi:hypothetical protein
MAQSSDWAKELSINPYEQVATRTRHVQSVCGNTWDADGFSNEDPMMLLEKGIIKC